MSWNCSLISLAENSTPLSHRVWYALCTDRSNCSNFALLATTSRLLPFSRLSRVFHNLGLQDCLLLNWAIVRLWVILPIIGACPDLSKPLFLRWSNTCILSFCIRFYFVGKVTQFWSVFSHAKHCYSVHKHRNSRSFTIVLIAFCCLSSSAYIWITIW